jgi:hypothetical protein
MLLIVAIIFTAHFPRRLVGLNGQKEPFGPNGKAVEM